MTALRQAGCVGLAIVCCGLVLSGNPRAKVLPVDQGSTDSSFGSFRSELLAAAERKDLSAVLLMIDPGVKTNVMEARGITALRKQWKIDESPDEFLTELRAILKLGGRFLPGRSEFVAPYTYTDFHGSEEESGDYVVVLGRDVPAYVRPSRTSGVSARLSHDSLRYWPAAEPGWVEVLLPVGRKAFVQEDQTRSPGAAHAVFRKSGERWLLSEFWGGVE